MKKQLKNVDWTHFDSGLGQLAGSRVHDNKPSRFHAGKECLQYPGEYLRRRSAP